MTGNDSEIWAAHLAADPALRAAWDGFRAQLAKAAGALKNGDPPDIEDVCRAMTKIFGEAGLDRLHH